MKMSEEYRDNLISSGPARFCFLSAFHPNISSRQIHYLGSKLAISQPVGLFEVICKLDIISAHLKKFRHISPRIESRTLELKTFCKALSNIYQVIFTGFLVSALSCSQREGYILLYNPSFFLVVQFQSDNSTKQKHFSGQMKLLCEHPSYRSTPAVKFHNFIFFF